MDHGGKRPGAGRPKGSLGARTRMIRAHVAASGLTPMDYMLSVMADPKADPTMRLEAAKAVAPYVHPRLSATELTMADPREGDTPEQVMAQIKALVAGNPQLAQALHVAIAEADSGNGDGGASNVVPLKPTAA